MKAKEIYDILRQGGLSRAGALGMLGNMQAESSLIPNIVQRGMTNATDVVYTAEVDDGTRNFEDSVGYGLCQWTFFSRKRFLLKFAKENGCSVGDGAMQVNFCLTELQTNYPKLYMFLCSSDDVDACADKICTDYECPAVNNFLTRRSFAHKFASEIKEETVKPKDPVKATFPPDASVLILQMVMKYNGYWEDVTGYKSAEFYKKLEEFIADMKKS